MLQRVVRQEVVVRVLSVSLQVVTVVPPPAGLMSEAESNLQLFVLKVTSAPSSLLPNWSSTVTVMIEESWLPVAADV